MVLNSLGAEPPGSARSRCACGLNGLPKPPVFFRPPDRRNIGLAHLEVAIASSERSAAHDRGNVVFGGFLQPPSNGFSSDRWALITALTP